jgi:DNA (cytosine-5)-methyltransferase 1
MGSLFAGIGGFDLAFERAGFRPAWQVEIDTHAQQVLARHWPDVTRHADIRDVGAHNLAPVDVITFGSPCQDLSVAGKRAGLAGARSGLFHEAVRVIRELRPRYAIWENVPGALSSAGGRDFGTALDALAECGAVDICWRVLDAQFFGVAQRRRRLFVVADFRDRRAAEILALADSLSGHPAPRREAREGTPAGTGSGAGSGGGYSLTGQTQWREGVGPLAASDDNGSNHVVASAITASAGHHGHSSPQGDGSDNLVVVAEPLAFTSKDSGGDVGTTSPTLRAMNYDQSHLNGGGQVAIFEARYARNGRGAPEAVCPPLKAQSGQTGKGDSAPLVFQQNQRNEVRLMGGDGQQAPPLAAQPGMKQQNYVAAAAVVRRLMPVECERLQGFPDGWTEPHADSHRYRLLGNAVCVNVAEWLGRRVMEVLS